MIEVARRTGHGAWSELSESSGGSVEHGLFGFGFWVDCILLLFGSAR